MKKLLVVFVLFISILGLTGCENKDNQKESSNNFITTEVNEDGNIIIDTKDITNDATFVNYEVDGITIQFIVVRGTDEKVRIAFNTCQSCNPSPNAYFIQVGEYLQCQNCGNKFHINKIGEEKGGCNPAPVEEMSLEDEIITISANYVEMYKDKFKNWNGPKA